MPFTENENFCAALAKLGSLANEPICDADVEICYHVPRKDSGCLNIVVQFHSHPKRDAGLLEKA